MGKLKKKYMQSFEAIAWKGVGAEPAFNSLSFNSFSVAMYLSYPTRLKSRDSYENRHLPCT